MLILVVSGVECSVEMRRGKRKRGQKWGRLL
jgi:hypothetical protein